MFGDQKRNLGIDILCCIGVMLLLGLQYMDAIGFLAEPVTGRSATGIAIRWFCLSGAAVLCAGTGYVLSTKRFTAGYFRILIRLVYVYLVCSFLALAIRVVLLGDLLSTAEAFQAIVNFSATQTSRFAGMYFALLIAAPYLNAAFHGLRSRRAQMSLLVLLLLTAGLQPMLCFDDVYMLPEWCKGLFPAAAYIGGAYIRKYTKQRRLFFCILALAAIVTAETAIVLFASLPQGVLYCPQLDSMASLPSLLIGLLLLTLLHSDKNGDSSVHTFFAGAAGGSIAALLLGDLIIDAAMPAIDERFPAIEAKLIAGFAVIPVLFILCCVMGLVLQVPLYGVRSLLHSDEAEEDEEDEEETPQPPRRSRKHEITIPGQHIQPGKKRADNRHTISVPFSVPEMTVSLTQPGQEPPQGVYESHLPGQMTELPVPEEDEPEEDEGVRVYVPKHAAAPEPEEDEVKVYKPRHEVPRVNSTVPRKTSSAITAAAEAAARREQMTVDDILRENARRRPQRDTMQTVSQKNNRLSD